MELSAGQGTTTGLPITEGNTGQILSEGLRMKFRTVAQDSNTPNHAEIDVYNLAATTAKRLIAREFSYVILQAGYSQGRYGVIFQGQIKQALRYRENAADTVMRIFAADSDWAFNQAPITGDHALEMPRGSTAGDRQETIAQHLYINGVKPGDITAPAAGFLPRGKIMFGLAPALLDTTSAPYSQWSIQNSNFQSVPLNGYRAGEAVVLNVHSGLVHMPVPTEDGVTFTCLLNPALKVRGLVKINNGDINTGEPAAGQSTGFGSQGEGNFVNYPGYTDTKFFAPTDDDGVYVVLVLEYEGDTRANAWYTHGTCMLLDQSSAKLLEPLPTADEARKAQQNAQKAPGLPNPDYKPMLPEG